MSFLYFAYGSNLSKPRMSERCPSARSVGTAVLTGWRLVCDKPSTDGSAKFNIRPARRGNVHGALYEIDDNDRPDLDDSEPRYTPIEVEVDGHDTITYTYEGEPFRGHPHDWYVELALAGAAGHGVPDRDIRQAVVKPGQ